MQKLSKVLSPFISRVVTNRRLVLVKRRVFKLMTRLFPSLDVVIFYHRFNDPYSYLLLQALVSFESQYAIKINIQLLLHIPESLNPEKERSQLYALTDADRMAHRYGFVFPKNAKQPSEENCLLAISVLLADENHKMSISNVLEITQNLWEQTSKQDNFSLASQYSSRTECSTSKLKNKLAVTLKKLLDKGHYMSAMLYYGGEWYWGIDRFGYLVSRLTQDTASYVSYPDIKTPYLSRKNKKPVEVIDFYFSFRSPYSYLAAVKLFRLTAHYSLEINILPVKPMVMRGLKVPKIKRLYIVRDAKREADRHKIPFGNIYDPLGGGVERCHALFLYAQKQNKAKEFILSVTTGIWSEGADVCNDKVLAKLLARAGLDWGQAESYLQNTQWHKAVEANQLSLHSLGLWGVPSFSYNNLNFWGQDRIWLIEDSLTHQV